MKKILCLILALVIMLGLTSCAKKGDETFKIGCVIPLSGGLATPGIEGQKSLDLAASYINENGGFNGVPIELIYYDTTSSNEEAVKVTQKAVVEDNVDAVISSVSSGEVAATLPYLNQQKVWNFGLGTSASWMEDDSMIYTFRASPNNGIGATALAEVLKNLGIKTAGILYATDDVGVSSSKAFNQLCADIGIKVVSSQGCDPEETDFSGQCASLIQADPDVVCQCLVATNMGPALKQLANLGYEGFVCGMEDIGPMYYDIIGIENLEHYFVCYPYVCYRNPEECDIPKMKEYLEMFVDKYGSCPSHNAGYRGWDTLMVMWEASKIAGKNDTESLREATHKVKIEGIGGAIDYTSGNREAYSNFNSFIFIGGRYVLFENWKKTDEYKEFMASRGL